MELINIEQFKFTRATLEAYSNELIQVAKNNLKNGNHNASSRLSNTMTFEIKRINNNFKVVIVMPSYWYYTNYGRKPGKQPPIDKIQIWIQQKGIKPSRMSIKSLAFLIARKIALKGTRPTYFMSLALRQVNLKYTKLIGKTLRKDLSESILTEYQDTVKKINSR